MFQVGLLWVGLGWVGLGWVGLMDEKCGRWWASVCVVIVVGVG